MRPLIPALEKTTSRGPWRSTASWTARRTCAESVTSQTAAAEAAPSSATASRSRSSTMPAMYTRAPSATKRRAVSSPMPLSPPVMNATLSCRRSISGHSDPGTRPAGAVVRHARPRSSRPPAGARRGQALDRRVLGCRRASQQGDREQSQPGPAGGDREALEQPAEGHQARNLGEAHAGEDERDREHHTCRHRVDRPPALVPSGEAPREHEACGRQSREGEDGEQVVEGAVRAVAPQVGAPRRVAAHGVGREEAGADQADGEGANQERSPGRAAEGPQRAPQTDGEGHAEDAGDEEVGDLRPTGVAQLQGADRVPQRVVVSASGRLDDPGEREQRASDRAADQQRPFRRGAAHETGGREVEGAHCRTPSPARWGRPVMPSSSCPTTWSRSLAGSAPNAAESMTAAPLALSTMLPTRALSATPCAISKGQSARNTPWRWPRS